MAQKCLRRHQGPPLSLIPENDLRRRRFRQMNREKPRQPVTRTCARKDPRPRNVPCPNQQSKLFKDLARHALKRCLAALTTAPGEIPMPRKRQTGNVVTQDHSQRIPYKKRRLCPVKIHVSGLVPAHLHSLLLPYP